jgi:2-phospho-L-lactate guanylyltransferase
MQGLWAIIPVKPLVSGKTRLSKVLDDKSRMALIKKLVIRTIKSINITKQFEHCLVISNDRVILEIAQKNGVETLFEENPIDLNRAVVKGIEYVQEHNGNKVLILHSDLPLIKAKNLNEILNLGKSHNSIVISPDRHLKGTNIIYLNPIGNFAYHYGENSFTKHLEEIKKSIYQVQIYNHINVALDLDLPEDLELYKKHTKKS